MPSQEPALVCPRCRHVHDGRLVYHRLEAADGSLVRLQANLTQSALHCPNQHCRASYPVFRGIPAIGGFGAYAASGNPPFDVLALTPETLLATLQGAAPGSWLSELVARIGRYLYAGFADWLASDDPVHGPLPRASCHALDLVSWLRSVCPETEGERLLVLGAALGREAWEHPGPSVLFEAHLPSLLAARHLLDRGELVIPLSREPGRWSLAHFRAPRAAPASVALLCADVANPPLEAGVGERVLAANLIDSVDQPFVALGQAAALTSASGVLAVSSPFTWRENVTPRAQWLSANRAHDSIRGLEATMAEVAPAFRELDRVELPWSIRAGDREVTHYSSLAVAYRQMAG